MTITVTDFHQTADVAATHCLFGSLDTLDDQVTFDVVATTGDLFPDANFWVTVHDDVRQPNPTYADDREVIWVETRTGNTMVGTRAQLGTTNRKHPGIVAVRLQVMGEHFRELQVAVNALQTLAVVADFGTDSFVGDGATAIYTLSAAPTAGTLAVYIDGIRCWEGVNYTIAGNILTFVANVPDGWVIQMEYQS